MSTRLDIVRIKDALQVENLLYLRHCFLIVSIINTKKVMKNMKFGFIGALAIATSMFFAGCTDLCKDVNCNNGECVEGDCVCDAGYESDDCSVALNTKFSGAYSNNESCTVSGVPAAPYAVTVAPKSSSAVDVTFTGLWEETAAIVDGTVGTDGVSFTIERQAIRTGFDITATGTANADGTTINVTYTIIETTGNTTADVCTAVLTK